MGKPSTTQPNSRKDSFFVRKKRDKPERNRSEIAENSNRSAGNQPFSQHSTANTGNFLVSASDKLNSFRKKTTFQPRQTQPDQEKNGKPKKEFDKKKWRLQKYSKKYKLDQWEEKRKKSVLHEYYKQIKDDGPKWDVQKIYEKYDQESADDDEQLQDKQEESENENNLNKDMRDEQTTSRDNSLGAQPQQPEAAISGNSKRKAFKKANVEYLRIKDDKKRKREEFERKKAEKTKALQEYKKNKLEKYRKLNKKTKKGQPIMKYRMEMLLEQIQKSVQ